MRKSVLIVSLGVVALGCAAFIAVPDWIQHKAIEAAAAQGVKLQIGSTHLGLSGIRFEDSNATTVRMPSANIHIDEISTNWNADSIIVNGADATIDGPPHFMDPQPTDNPVPNHLGTPIHLASAHISWTHILGNINVDISNISGDYDSSARGGDTYKWSGNTAVLIGGKTIGPFATDFATDRGSSNRIVLSSDADGPTPETFAASFSPGFSAIDLSISGRTLSKIGVPLDAFGIHVASDPDVSLHLTDNVKRLPNTPPHGDGMVKLSLGPVAISGLPAPSPVSLDLSWSGDPDVGMSVTQSQFSVAPFSGPITGTIARPEGAIALNLVTETNPVACSKLSSSNPMQGGIIGSVAAMAGMKSDVVGDVKIDGAVQFDSRNPGDRRISFVPNNTCGLSISLGSGGK